MVPDLAELVQSAEDTTSLLHLPLDFDFGLYLSTVYAKTVAHIVELDWPAWVAVQGTAAAGSRVVRGTASARQSAAPHTERSGPRVPCLQSCCSFYGAFTSSSPRQ